MQDPLHSQLKTSIYESLHNFLFSNAVFLAERFFYESKSEESLSLLCECHLLENKPYKVYSLLKNSNLLKNNYLYGISCLRMNKTKEAEIAFRKCFESEYKTSFSAYMLGFCYEKQQNFKEAASYYLKALEKNPTLWTAYEKLCHMGSFIAPSKVFNERKTSEYELSKESVNFFNYYEKVENSSTNEKNLNLQMNSINTPIDILRKNSINPMNNPINNGINYSRINTTNTNGSFMNNFEKNFNINSSSCNPNNRTISSICSFLSIFAAPLYLYSKFQVNEAVTLLLKLPKNHYHSGWTMYQMAKCHMELRKYLLAEEFFQKSLEFEPYNIEYMGLYSNCLWQLKKSMELAYLSNKALEQSRFESESWVVVGNCYSLEKEHENALKFFNRALQIKPDTSFIHGLCGHEYMYIEDFFNAKKSFEIALGLDKRNYNAWWGLGNICFKEEKYDKAIQHFQRAININAKNSILYTFLGMAFNCKRIYGEALKNFDLASGFDDKNYLCRFQKANSLLQLEQYDLALMELEKLKFLMPNESSVVVMIAKIYHRLGIMEKANYYMNLALDLEPHASQKIKESVGFCDPVMF